MPRTRRRLESEVRALQAGEPAPAGSPGSSVADPYPSRPKRRARSQHVPLLGELERALRRLQEAASGITVVGMREQDPVTYEIGNDAWTRAEELRWRIRRALP